MQAVIGIYDLTPEKSEELMISRTHVLTVLLYIYFLGWSQNVLSLL